MDAAGAKIRRLSEAGLSLSRNDRKIVIFGSLLTTLDSVADAACFQPEGADIKDGAPLFVLNTLCTYGGGGHEEFKRLRQRCTERNRLVHGLPALSRLEDVRFMIDFTRQLMGAVPDLSDA